MSVGQPGSEHHPGSINNNKSIGLFPWIIVGKTPVAFMSGKKAWGL